MMLYEKRVARSPGFFRPSGPRPMQNKIDQIRTIIADQEFPPLGSPFPPIPNRVSQAAYPSR